MRIKSFIKFYIILIAFLFVFYSSSYAIELNLQRKVFLFFAVSLLSPYLFKWAIAIRGVRKGDLVLLSLSKQGNLGFFMQKVPATALGNGRKRDIIEVEFNSRKGKGEIVSYGGFFFPPEVRMLYFEDVPAYRETTFP